MTIALIPARGGSKRIPRKNIKPFFGKPIIAYSIQTAIQSGCFEKVIVSTDDQEIAQIATSFGAQVPFIRPPELSDDHATTMQVIEHAINWHEDEYGEKLDDICCIYPTAPLLLASDLQASRQRFGEGDVQYCYAACEFPAPVQRSFTIDKSSRPKMLMPDEFNARSQDLAPVYFDAGQFYWCKAQAVRDALPIFDEHSRTWPMDPMRVQDIDTIADWEFAELLYQRLHAKTSSELSSCDNGAKI